jgi:hypothetical protein
MRASRAIQGIAWVCIELVISACVQDTALWRSDNSDEVQAMVRDRAARDLRCPDVLADRPIRGDRMDNWPEELHSEYNAWAEGCGRRASYRVLCWNGNLCAFSDRPRPGVN